MLYVQISKNRIFHVVLKNRLFYLSKKVIIYSVKLSIEELRPSTAMKPGQEARVDYEYIRNGVVNIFIANELLKGKRFVEVTEFKTKKDWSLFIKELLIKGIRRQKR